MPAELRAKAELGEISRIRCFLKETVRDWDIPEDDFFKIDLSLHEICVNIIDYAYPQEQGDIELKIWKAGKAVVLQITDAGIPFDPSKVKKPDLEKKLRAGTRGGYGIFLVHAFMDAVCYRRDNNRNVLTVSKNIL
jgi:anti-sigma regulatory factor (Ser/Thr protein kinase)